MNFNVFFLRLSVFVLFLSTCINCSKDDSSDDTVIVVEETDPVVISEQDTTTIIDDTSTITEEDTSTIEDTWVDNILVPTGSNPWDFFLDCRQWKITWVDGSEEKDLCSQEEVESQYEISVDQDALVFSVYMGGELGTTSNNTSYSRSELRERVVDDKGNAEDIYWTTEGDHALYIEQAITHLPLEKDHLVTGQIHGNKADGIDDSMVVRLEGDHLFLSFNGGKLREDITIKEGYELGTKFEVIMRIVDGKHYCYYSEDGKLRLAYNNDAAETYLLSDAGSTVLLDLNYDETYFKVGNYCQSNEEKEGDSFGDADNYCEVYVYAFNVSHTGEEI